MLLSENLFMKRAKCFFVLTLLCVYAHSANYLFKDGKTDYSIVVQSGASISERTAAHELREIIKSIALKENIKFIPSFIDIPIFIYKLCPIFISNLIQKFIINPFSRNIGRREENDALFFK